MTSTVTDATIKAITGQSYDAFSVSVGVVVVLLLLGLITARELVRAAGGAEARGRMRALDVAVLPLLCAFGMIIILRLVDLLPHG
ncbi:MAG: hypothetical protein ACR2M0_16040 [Chloroflexia bacterium]